MMVPYCLQQLELDTTADERAIRRAYAQKLKKIDQAADPAGFQALRSAYEAALAWVRDDNRDAATDLPSDGTCDAPQVVEPVPANAPWDMVFPTPWVHRASKDDRRSDDEARVLASDAFTRFTEAFDAATANRQALPDVEAVRAMLEETMAGDALVNMVARNILEHDFACLLIQGWKPGHEALFVAVTDVFRWDEDRRHLYDLGEVGFQIDRALQERAMFDRLKPRTRRQRELLIARLRSPSAPDARELKSSYWLLEDLYANFPTWLGIVTDLNNLPRWRELHAALPPRQRGRPILARKRPVISYWHGWALMTALILLIKGIGHLNGEPSHPPPPVPLRLATSSELPVTLPELVGKAPSPQVCEEISRIYVAFGTGTSFQDVKLGESFDRQIAACIGKLIWPQSTLHDTAIGQVLLRDRLRLVAEREKTLVLDPRMRTDVRNHGQATEFPRGTGTGTSAETPPDDTKTVASPGAFR